MSFTIDCGECVAVLGQNGSGKSTLVRVLSTLLLPERGHAAVFGHDVIRDSAAVRRLVNRVSAEASFFKRMSALENLSYAARFYGLTPKVTRTRIPEILERVGSPRSRSSEPMEDLPNKSPLAIRPAPNRGSFGSGTRIATLGPRCSSSDEFLALVAGRRNPRPRRRPQPQ